MSLKSLARSAAPTFLAALALATPASASTRGSTTGFGDFGCAAGDIVWSNSASYTMLDAGVVTSFSVQTRQAAQGTESSAGQQLDALVLRPVGSNHFTVVGKSGTLTDNGSGAVQTFPVTSIAVRAGDVLGVFNVTGRSLCFDFGGGFNLHRSAPGQTDPAVGSDVQTVDIFANRTLNLAANFEPVTGSGNTAGTPVNAFSFDTSAGSTGTVTFSDGTLNYNGTITCFTVVGNAATIVSIDTAVGKGNRLMAQDNGASGDKLINTMFILNKLSPASLAKAQTCIAPDIAALTAKRPLDGDSIQIPH